MKKNFFLFALLVLSSFGILYPQTWINDEKDLTASSTNIEQFKNKGGTQTVYQSSSYAIGRKLNTDSSSFISRSYHQFNIDLSVFPTNTQIDEVTVHYTTSAGTYSYKLTKVGSIGTDDAANWSAIAGGTSMDGGIAYSAVENSFVSAKIKTEMQNLLTSGKIILGALSENETANDSYADLFIWLHIKFRRPAQTFPYYAANYYNGSLISGQIGVGLGQPPTSYVSPKQFDATENQNVNLLAYDNQDIGTRRYLYNDTEAPNHKSKWDQNKFEVITELGEPQSITVVANSVNGGATLRAWLSKNCKIDQTHNTEFDGNLTQQNLAYIVENNSGNITAPSSKTVGSNNYNFSYWTDGFSAQNPRTITPTDNQTYTALYKVTHKSNSTTAYSNNNQRKVVKSTNGYLHLVYESMNKVWYELSTDNGSTWQLANNGKPLSLNDSKLPSVDYNNAYVGITWQEKFNDSYKIKFAYFDSYGNMYSDYVVQNEPGGIFGDYYSTNADPVFAWGNNGEFMIVWKEGNTTDALFYRLGAVYYFYWGVQWNSDPTFITGSSGSPGYPTISTRKDAGTLKFHLAWQQSTSSIKYCSLTPDVNHNVIISTVETPSIGSGFTYNQNPNIIASGDFPSLVWVGKRYVDYAGMWETRAVNRSKTAAGWASSFQLLGASVESPTISTLSIISWSENGGSANKFFRWGNIKSFGTLGKDLQLCNSNDLNTMKAIGYRLMSPYYFYTTPSAGSIAKENSIVNHTGKQGTIRKDDAEFYFVMGDVSLNGSIINFIEADNDSVLERPQNLTKSLLQNLLVSTIIQI
jgi:hypothetical protein